MSMFYDYAKVYVKGGDGGNGIVAFRREKYVPMGGPSGGDGGRGGSVILVGDKGLKTLVDFRYKRHYKGKRGEHGETKNMHGHKAENMYLKVPLGTICRDYDTGELLADITEDGQEAVIAKGGRGGRGNSRFATAHDKGPRMAENGEPGQERNIALELKLLADVGLVGLPNAGKSTLITRSSAARPKIANYPFTTLEPNLGVVDIDYGEGFVMADLPGLVEGAADGVGLGHRFLRHVERTKVLLHVIDLSGLTGQEPYEAFKLINEELRRYREDLLERPQVIVANKADLPDFADTLAEFRKQLAADGLEYEIFPVSAATGQGVKELLYRTWELVKEAPEPTVVTDEERKETVVRADDQWQITESEPGVWDVKGYGVEKLVAMTNMDNEAAVARMQKIFAKNGFDAALKKAGLQEGDLVRIGKEEFDYAE